LSVSQHFTVSCGYLCNKMWHTTAECSNIVFVLKHLWHVRDVHLKNKRRIAFSLGRLFCIHFWQTWYVTAKP
jgi:hypothetical protein